MAPDPPSPRLLIVEDDSDLALMLVQSLSDEGYTVDLARNGQRGLQLGQVNQYDVLVVDRQLPGIEGIDVVRRLRRRGVSTPALILTTGSEGVHRVAGLDAGAEDYLSAPFDRDELLARIRGLRRRQKEMAGNLAIGSARLLVADLLVRLPDGHEVELTPRECDLLEILAREPDRLFTREDLDRAFGGGESVGSVDTYVQYLRHKLGRGVIRTVRSRSYRIGVL